MHHPTYRIAHTTAFITSVVLAQTRNDIFGRCGVVESFQFHPELVLKNLKDSEFYSKF